MQAQRNVSGPIRQQEQQVSWHIIAQTKCVTIIYVGVIPTWVLMQVDFFFFTKQHFLMWHQPKLSKHQPKLSKPKECELLKLQNVHLRTVYLLLNSDKERER